MHLVLIKRIWLNTDETIVFCWFSFSPIKSSGRLTSLHHHLFTEASLSNATEKWSSRSWYIFQSIFWLLHNVRKLKNKKYPFLVKLYLAFMFGYAFFLLFSILQYSVSPSSCPFSSSPIPIGGSGVKNLPSMQETWVWSLGWEDPLEKEIATHSSTIDWKIPWTAEPGRLQSTGPRELDMTLQLNHHHYQQHDHIQINCKKTKILSVLLSQLLHL